MCATSDFKLTAEAPIALPDVEALVAQHGLYLETWALDEAGHVLRASLQPLDDTEQPLDEEERKACWCWVSYEEDRAAQYTEALRTVLYYLASLGELVFWPDCFDYKLSGDWSMLASEVPLPVMGDGRRILVLPIRRTVVTTVGGDAP